MSVDSLIRNIITQDGYIKIDDMMENVLSIDPQSYYRSSRDIGQNGDFITAPEISQLFGEIIALWSIHNWQKLGCPNKFALIELGPGRGTLMRDLLRTAAKILPEFFQAAQIYLHDINPYFIKVQQEHLKIFDKNIQWIKMNYVPSLPIIVVANEFFDSMPIKQFIKVRSDWFESVLITDPLSGWIKYDKIRLSEALQDQLNIDHKEAKDGAVIEESIKSLEIIRSLSQHIVKYTGVILIIDYGYNIPNNDRTRNQYSPTLQAIKNHQYWPIIDSLSNADLTAHVDFDSLLRAAKEFGIRDFQFRCQGDFLREFGIEQRAKILKQNLYQNERYLIDKQVSRLVAKDQMGELFKVLEITSSSFV